MKKTFRLHSMALLVVIVSISFTQNSIIDDQPKPSTSFVEKEQVVEIFDDLAESIIDRDAKMEILATGFYWSEGPVWVEEMQTLLFSDVPANKIYQWSEKDSLRVYLEYAGHTGEENKNSGSGSNGLLLDKQGNVLICQHGDRKVVRLKSDLKRPKPSYETLADNYRGKKFNSPNDLALDNAGTIYFTDPPYGRPGGKTGEIGMNGVFSVNRDGKVTLLVDSLTRPNGIAISLDEKKIYINQSDPENPVLISYDIDESGKLKHGEVLYDFKSLSQKEEGLPDGLKVHKSGNIFATGPGGVHIISPKGKLLATIKTGKKTANCAFDTDQTYLYTTTTDQLMRIKLK